MNVWPKALAISLASTLLLSSGMPAYSDSVWVPRLGYPTIGAKRVYVDVVTPEQREAEIKDKKSQEKQAKKEAKAQLKAQREQAEEKSEQSSKEDDDTQHQESKEAKRKQAAADRYARRKAQAEARMAERLKRPVDGSFYLFNVKQDRLLFDEFSTLYSADKDAALTPFYVEFKEGPTEGLYDLAVRGSGHRSEKPIWISDTIYWDAMRPVLQDLGKAHCPSDTGKYRVMQQCFWLNALSPSAESLENGDQKLQVVQGGWYTDFGKDVGIAKSTAEIANLTQLLLNIYNVNPASYKYLMLDGGAYAQSRYPDILDEANWGLQYLLTIQQPDGGFPGGIKHTEMDGRTSYQLMPQSYETTSRAVMALASAAKSFQKEDLSLSVKFLRAAEKGWRSLRTQSSQPELEPLLLASGALMQVSDNPEYTEVFYQTKKELKAVSPETALLLSAAAKGIPLQKTSAGIDKHQISLALPMAVKLQQENVDAAMPLARWVTDLFGYEEISLVKDAKLETASAWSDPLQWMATKTGEMATRLGYRLEEEGIIRPETKADSGFLKTLEEKELEARRRAREGYKTLSLNSSEKVHLAYVLALLNQHVASVAPEAPKEESKPSRDPYEEAPPGTIKGFYPQPL